MVWLIDGYNVIRRDADLRGAEAAGLPAGWQALLRLIAGAARRSPDRFTIVFDGARPHEAAAGSFDPQVEIVFSRPPSTADDELLRRARAARDAAIVVSSDRAVLDAARRAGCATVTAEAFLAGILPAPPGAPAAGDPDDADEEDDDAADQSRGPKRGNPRRRSRRERATQQALRRLRGT